jgi:TRAP-type C4-dicarboxylate transport system permease small subunit
MQFDLLTLLVVGAGIALAVLIAVVAGTVAARLFFHASGLAQEDVARRREKPLR